jgi:hypothetical protein
VFSHENILVIGRVAETQVVKELIRARYSPEASLAVDGLDEVRSHLGVVTRQSSCNVKFTTHNTLQKQHMHERRKYRKKLYYVKIYQ